MYLKVIASGRVSNSLRYDDLNKEIGRRVRFLTQGTKRLAPIVNLLYFI